MIRFAVIFSICLASINSPALGARKALVIGNGTYSEFPVLSESLNDVDLMRDVFSQLNFIVYAHKDLTVAGLQETFAGFASEVSAEDEVVIYCSGHGCRIGNENYLLPVDLKAKFQSELKEQCKSVESLVSELQAAGAVLSVVFLDSFRSEGELLYDNAQSTTASRIEAGIDLGSGTPATISEVLICHAAEPGKAALKSEGPFSVYSLALARELSIPGQELIDSLRNVRNNVLSSSGRRQLPGFSGSVGRSIVWAEPERKLVVSYNGSEGVKIRQDRDFGTSAVCGTLFHQTAIPLIQNGNSIMDQEVEWVQVKVQGWIRAKNSGSVFLNNQGDEQWMVNRTPDNFVAMRVGKSMDTEMVCKVSPGTLIEELDRDFTDEDNPFILGKFSGWVVKQNPKEVLLHEIFP